MKSSRDTALVFGVFSSTVRARAEAAAGRARRCSVDKTIPLPDVKGGFDDLAIDALPSAVVAAKSNDSLKSLTSPRARSRRASPASRAPGRQGDPQAQAGRDLHLRQRQVSVFDLQTLALVKEIELDETTDNLRYEPKSKRVYVGDGKSHLVVTDPVKGAKLSEVALESPACAFEIESAGIASSSTCPRSARWRCWTRRATTVKATFTLGGRFRQPRHRARRAEPPAVRGVREGALLVLDTETGQGGGHGANPQGADDMQFDKRRKLIFLSLGEGSATMIQQKGADDYRLLGSTPTAKGAKTSTVPPELRLFAVAVPAQDAQVGEDPRLQDPLRGGCHEVRTGFPDSAFCWCRPAARRARGRRGRGCGRSRPGGAGHDDDPAPSPAALLFLPFHSPSASR